MTRSWPEVARPRGGSGRRSRGGSELRSKPEELEVRILARLAAGHNYVQIAAAEYLSSRTVRRLVRELKQRTGVTSLPGLCAEASRRGWLTMTEQH